MSKWVVGYQMKHGEELYITFLPTISKFVFVLIELVFISEVCTK